MYANSITKTIKLSLTMIWIGLFAESMHKCYMPKKGKKMDDEIFYTCHTCQKIVSKDYAYFVKRGHEFDIICSSCFVNENLPEE